MITIDRRLGGLLPYRTVFFPTDSALREQIERPKASQMTRLFWTASELGDEAAHVVRHDRSATICIDLKAPLEALFSEVAKNTRNEIRRAEKMADRVHVRRNSEGCIDEFLALYNDFARSKPEISAIDRSAVSHYGKYADVFLAYLDGRPLCSHVLLRDDEIGRARLLYSVSRRFDDRETARWCGILNRFLHWREITLYRDEGFQTYDLGGIEEDESNGITQLKKSFGGQVIEEHTYVCAGVPMFGRLVQTFFESLTKRGRQSRSLRAGASARANAVQRLA